MTFKKVALATVIFAGISGMSLNANAAASSEVTLQGVITNTACNVTVNGGKSILNVGIFKSSSFTANTISAAKVDMPVTLTECGAEEEQGNLIVQGLTSIANNNQNLFVASDNDTVGFMIENTAGDTMKNGAGATLTIAKDATEASYTFKVGMASTSAAPQAGAYSAPILVAYISN